MEDNNKAVGPLAAAKLVALIKAMTAKKYDKTGGKIDGSAEITGGLKVGMSSEFSSSIKAGSEISSDMLLMAPIVTLHDPATEESISFDVSGENAAKVTSPVSGGGTQYARLAVGTPTGDNDAATKAYVDAHAVGYEVITVTSTNVSDVGYDASEGAHKFAVTFDASFDSILANLAANKPMKFNITIPDNTGGFPLSFTTGYVSALGNSMYEFTGTLAGAPVVLSISALGSASVYLYADYLPDPNPDDSDDGKALVVNKHKWEMKKVDAVTEVATEATNGLMSAADKKKLDSMYDIVATSTDGETFDITPAQLHEKLKGVPTACAIKVVDTIIPLHRVQLPGDGSTKYIFQTTKDNGFWEPNTRLAYTASAGGTYAGTIWGKSEYDLLASTPGILKFTGAAEAQFSGSKDVTIDIPTGEGAVRYDETQKLTSDQKFRASQNIGAVSQKHAFIDGVVMLQAIGHDDGASVVNITPSEKSNDYTLTLDGGPENVPVYVAGLETPTDAQTDYATNVAYVKEKIAEVAASGGVDVDNALSATSTNPVQNKVVKAALDKKAGTAVATASANGLMSKSDKAKMDGIASGATNITIDSTMSGSSNNPVANHVVKQYVDDKVAAAGSNITVDAALSSTSTNPVQNKAIKEAIDVKADKTALDAKVDKTALDAKMDKSGGTFTGNVYGKYFCGTWLQSTAASDLGRTPGKIAVLDDSGWMYYRTTSELLADLGVANAIKSYVDTAIIAAINNAY